MADQAGNPNGTDVKNTTLDQELSDEALLFDESTVLSRSENSGQEEQDSIDTSDILGNTQESGNENIQTFVDGEDQVDRTEYSEGLVAENKISDQAMTEEDSADTSVTEGLAPSDGAQLNLQDSGQSVDDARINPQPANPNTSSDTSDAVIDDFIAAADSVDATTLLEESTTDQDNQETAEEEPEEAEDTVVQEAEPTPESNQTPEPEPVDPDPVDPDSVDPDPTPVTVELTASTVDEDADDTSYVFTATLSEKSQGETKIVTNQGTITIAHQETTGSIKIASNNTEDVYKDASELTAEITSTEGNFKPIDVVGSNTATAKVLDTETPVDVTITATAKAQTINSSSAVDGSNGVTVTAFGNDGKETNLSVIKGTNHDGFGVETKDGSGKSVEKSNGDTKEIGLNEKIIVAFDKNINSIDVSFAWRNNHETAELTFTNNDEVVGSAKVTGDGSSTTKAIVTYFDAEGKEIKSVNAKGSSDKVDEAFTFELPDANGDILSFDKVEFTAPTKVDDYLIHEISYKQALDSSDMTVDENGQVTFAIQMDERYPPQGKAVATVEVNGKEIEVELNATGRGSLTVDAEDLGDLSKVVVNVVKVEGGNYEKVNPATEDFNFSGVLTPASGDDAISTNVNTAYTLKTNDFGDDLSANAQVIKITSEPENGTLYRTVIEGKTVIDKEGNIATESSKVEISANDEISLSDIEQGLLVFEPNENDDSDGAFQFSVGDGAGEFSEIYTTSITVEPAGATEGGTAEGGTAEGGAAEGGTTEDGATEDGATEDGATEGGTTEGGEVEEATTGDYGGTAAQSSNTNASNEFGDNLGLDDPNVEAAADLEAASLSKMQSLDDALDNGTQDAAATGFESLDKDDSNTDDMNPFGNSDYSGGTTENTVFDNQPLDM